ncbi:MAG TPA: PRC-barrel domain-containing protein [Thermodesulfobacteriota bacterium]|nr:PRC-barrel domain-containing protein [Thermodesulfobacteriota bacterium]
MKSWFTVLILATAVLLAAGPMSAFAQMSQTYPAYSENPSYPPAGEAAPLYGNPAYTPAPGVNQGPAYNAGKTYNDEAFRAKKIIGKHVVDQNGQKVGKISDLLIDPSGRVAFAVLDPSWGMGFGHGRFVALPLNVLSWNQASHDMVLTTPRDRLAQAPSFDEYHWPNMADRTWMGPVYQFYGVTPYWTVQ